VVGVIIEVPTHPREQPGRLQAQSGGIVAEIGEVLLVDPVLHRALEFITHKGIKPQMRSTDRQTQIIQHLADFLCLVAIVAGEIDALISPRQPSAYDDPSVERLFRDYRAFEVDYYKRTGFFPIMHGIGVRRSLAEKYPWLPRALYEAFCEGRRRALDDLTAFGVLRVTLPWIRAELDATEALMGPEIWPYGIERNLDELKTMARYAFEQGLADRVIDPTEMFDASLLET